MSLKTITFLDIETVPESEVMPPQESWQHEAFKKRFKDDIKEIESQHVNYQMDSLDKLWKQKAGLYAEFSKVVCVSLGRMQADKLYIKSYSGADEKTILTVLADKMLGATILCAHNGKEFDFPFLFRRYLINNLPVPEILKVKNKKNWDLPFRDTLEMWSHSQWKYKCSLDTIAQSLGLPSPKKDMDGSGVAEVYYSKDTDAIKRISEYCAGDILTMANVYAILEGEPIISPESVKYV